jgi:hypothetical protein
MSNYGHVLNYVNGGGSLIIHDSNPEGNVSQDIVPDLDSSTFVNVGSAQMDVLNPGSPIIDGPFGTVTDTTLDGGGASTHGYVEAATLPGSVDQVMSTGGISTRVAVLSYTYGSGYVIYTTIPAEFYANGFGPDPFKSNLVNIYLRNELVAALDANQPAPSTAISVTGSDLVIEDVQSGGKEDTLTIALDVGASEIVIQDPNNLLTTTVGSGDLTHEVRVPMGAFAGSVIVEARDGNDSLTIDSSLKSSSPLHDVDYRAGDPSVGPGDSLTLTGSATTVEHRPTNASDGQVIIEGFLDVFYSGLEPISDNLSAADRIFTFPATADMITLSDDGTASNDYSQIASTSSSETVVFRNPTNSLTVNTGGGTDSMSIQGLDALFDADLTINGDANDTVTFQTSPTHIGTGSLDVTANTINVNGVAVSTSGSGTVDLTAVRNIALTSGSSITTVDGVITLEANTAATTTGAFDGIDLDNANISSTSGDIALTGKGGSTSTVSINVGVQIRNGSVISSNGTGPGAGEITIMGTGGAGVSNNYGVYVRDPGSKISSIDGDIQIIGQGGNGSSQSNVGVHVFFGGRVESTGTGSGAGTITITGTGGTGTQANQGVSVAQAGATVSSIDGNIQISGQGGSGSTAGSDGVDISSSGRVESTGTGTDAARITVTGTGAGAGTGMGVRVRDTGSKIISVDGNIDITGQGGNGTGFNRGVEIYAGGAVESTGTGAHAATITIVGTGATTTSGLFVNCGVGVFASGSRVTSVDGQIDITGTTTGPHTANHGIAILAPGGDQDAGSGGEVTIQDATLSAPGGTTLNGGNDTGNPSDADIFNITPQQNSQITVNGLLPVLPTSPGDTLNLDLAGLNPPTVKLDAAPGSGTFIFNGPVPRQDVTFTSIEQVNATGPYHLVLDMEDSGFQDGSADNIKLQLNSAHLELEIHVNTFTPFFSGLIEDILSFQLYGSTDSDTLTIDDSGGLPVFADVLPDPLNDPGSSARPNNPLVFDGTFDQPHILFAGGAGTDALNYNLVLGTTDQTYGAGDGTGGGSGVGTSEGEVLTVNPTNTQANAFASNPQILYFTGLEPITTTGTPGGSLTVIGDETDNVFAVVESPLAGPTQRTQVQVATSDHLELSSLMPRDPFETFDFQAGAFSQLVINTLGGDDWINVQEFNPNEDALAGASVNAAGGQDKIILQSNAAAVNVPVTVNGGAGDDEIFIGDVAVICGHGLDNILGSVTVNGEAHIVADVLNLNDQGDGDNNVYDLTSTTVDRTGSGTITYTTVETLQINSGVGDNTFNVNSLMTDVGVTAATETTILNDAGGTEDRLDFSTYAAMGVTIDLDTAAVQQVSADGSGPRRLQLVGEGTASPFEHFTGSQQPDTVYADPLPVPYDRMLDGGDPTTLPGDRLLFDAQGQPVTDNGSMLTVTGFAPVDYMNFEKPQTVNFPALFIDNGDLGYYDGPVAWYLTTGVIGAFELDISSSQSDAGGTARWTFGDIPQGTYLVSASWGGDMANPSRATNAPYTIFDGDSGAGSPAVLAQVQVNQQQRAGDFIQRGTRWRELAVVEISGNALSVELTDSGANGVVVADAIRLEPFVTSHIIDDGDPAPAYTQTGPGFQVSNVDVHRSGRGHVPAGGYVVAGIQPGHQRTLSDQHRTGYPGEPAGPSEGFHRQWRALGGSGPGDRGHRPRFDRRVAPCGDQRHRHCRRGADRARVGPSALPAG